MMDPMLNPDRDDRNWTNWIVIRPPALVEFDCPTCGTKLTSIEIFSLGVNDDGNVATEDHGHVIPCGCCISPQELQALAVSK